MTLRGKRGTLAGLHDDLVSQGYSYHKQFGDWKSPTRELIYKKGKRVVRMSKVQSGVKPQWLKPKTSKYGSLVKTRTAQMPDTYELR